MTSSTDPFSASIIPFEVPEQMRALAEKGVSQARDSYAKFKDAAETHNTAIEAMFSSASKGASEYSAKLMEIMKTNTSATLDFAQERGLADAPHADDGIVGLWMVKDGAHLVLAPKEAAAGHRRADLVGGQRLQGELFAEQL